MAAGRAWDRYIAVDASVQGYEHAVEVHHADGAHVAVAHHIFLQGLFVGVFHRLLYRCGHPRVAAVAAVHLQDLDQHALARLIVLCGIHPPLIGKFPQRDVALRAEQINKMPARITEITRASARIPS